jgi:hypothetical protein
MKIKKRYIALGVLLCLWLGPAGVASIIALVKLVGVTPDDLAQPTLTPDA